LQAGVFPKTTVHGAMTRTTISLHELTLEKVRAVAHQSKATMGETITELLNLGLRAKTAHHHSGRKRQFRLKSFHMGIPRVSLEDKEGLNRMLDGRDT
jgi:hypothetical protein